MSDSAARLPARPSLEQLRKQARERLATMRAADPAATLAQAQYRLATEYGFESWPRLVHHVESVLATGRLRQFEQLAHDILAGYDGDLEALRKLIAHFGVGYSPEQFHPRVRGRVDDFRGNSDGAPSLEQVQALVAHQYGFGSWAELAQALAQPTTRAGRAHGGRPPFHRVDREQGILELLPPLAAADWHEIADIMTEHGLTGVRTSAMTDEAMASVSRLDVVTALHVSGNALSDDGVKHLARMPQLEVLELGGSVTDSGLAVLRQLPRLRRFAAGWMSTITDDGASNLGACDELETVDLMGTPTGDGVLDALRGKPRLRDLRTGRRVTDAGLAYLHELPVFARWQDAELRYDLMSFSPEPNFLLLDGRITDAGLASLSGLDGLFGLGFFRHTHTFGSAGIASLASLPKLGFLSIPGDRCDDDAMRAIAALPALRFLLAQGTEATDEGFVALSRSRTLEYLWGRECPNLRGRGFAALRELPALRGLAVSCRQVNDTALGTLPSFPALRELMPMDVRDAGFRHVGACRSLERLWCMYCRDTGDAATEHIAALSLRTYYAGKTRMTDRSCEILGRMTSLEEVELWETAAVTDAGVAALARLPRLGRLTISGVPRVTRGALEQFGPGVRVDYSA